MTVSRNVALARVALGGLVSALLTRRAEAETVSYTYDAVGRIASVTYSNGQTVTYTYDPAGNRKTLDQTVATEPAPTAGLSASPTTITQGQSTSLTWSSTYADSASIDNGVGAVTPLSGGSVSVSPSSTTTYTLNVSGPGGAANAQATVTVNPPAPTASLSASPTSITQGNSSTLTWSTTNSTSASINNSVGSVTPVSGGTVSVSPTSTTTYTITATGAGGQTTQQATVTVTPPPPSVSLNSSTWSWVKQGNGTPSVEPASITATASGGTTPYSYLWERTSGDSVTAVASGTSATTTWSRSSMVNNTVYESLWRCKVTDNVGGIGYSSEVLVSLLKLPGGGGGGGGG